MRLAVSRLFRPRWSADIQEEWIRNLSANRNDLDREKLERISALMNAAVPEALVEGYEDLIDSIALPDPDDQHVVAAAIEGKATVLVTINLRDFPIDTLAAFGIEPMHPDDFV